MADGERPSNSPLAKLASSVKRSGRLSMSGEGGRASFTGHDGEEKVVYINPSSLASGGIAEKAAGIFRVYDTGNKNALDHDAMMSALAELGVINGLTSKKLTEILSIGSDKAVGKGRSYTLQEFVSFYERLAHYQAKAARQERIKALSKMPEIPDDAHDNEVLKRVFLNYCRYTVGQTRSTFDEAEPKMSSTQYVKLCQDLGLVQPNGPLNVVTVDVIFHKCKPQGGRRLMYPHYLKALTAAAEESKMNVFDSVALLAQQINPDAKLFIAPEPVQFRQETRSMEQSKFKVASAEPVTVAEEVSSDEEAPAPLPRKPPKEKVLELSSDEELPERKKITPRERIKIPNPMVPGPAPASPEKPAPQEMEPIEGDATVATLYSMGQGGMDWLQNLPDDAPQWMRDMAGKVGELHQQVVKANKENYELRQQVKKTLAKSRLANGSGVDYAAFEALAVAAGLDPKTALASAQSGGAVSGADMAGLLVDVDKRLKAMEGVGGGRRGIKGVNREGGAAGEGEEGDEFDDLAKKVDELEKQLEEVRDGEKLRSEMKDDMKKLAKAAAAAATKGIPPLEQRVAACETKEDELEKGAQAQAAKISGMEGKLKQLSDNLQAEVGTAVAVEMTKGLDGALSQMLGPGGELGNVVEAKVQQMAVDLGDRVTAVEAAQHLGGAKVGALEGVVAEQAAKVEQALALAQESMNREVALAPKLATLEASGTEWARQSSSLDAAVRELQAQMKELQARNSSLEAEVDKLKSGAKDGKDGADGRDGLVAEEVVRGEAPGPKRAGVADMVAVAELQGRVMGLESTVKDAQSMLVTALTAVGFTPAEAAKDGAMVAAASKHAAQEAALSEINTRLGSVEAKQQEANVTLRKAEALLSGPAAGLAAINAASAAAASAASARKEKSVSEEVVVELNARLSSLESRHKEVAASLANAMSASSAVPALEAAINSKLPALETQLQTQNLAHATLVNKLGEFDAFITSVRTRLPELDSGIKVAEARVTELERKAGNSDRLMRDLNDHIKSLQAEQESMAANAAMSAQLRMQQGGGGGHSGGVDSSSLQLVMASEERLQKHIQQLKEALNNQIAELDAAKVKYDTNLEVMQATFEQLVVRMNTMEGGSGGESRIGYAKVSEMREMEDHLLDRLRTQVETSDKLQRAINQLVADVERLASSHNSSEQARVANAANALGGGRGPGMGAEQLALLEQRVDARLTLMSTQFVTHEGLRELELRFATTDAVRMAVDKARANDEVVLAAVKEVDKQLHEKLEVSQQVMLRMARQVDVLQNQLRVAPADAGPAQIKIIKGGGSTAPMPNVASTIPLPLARPESAGGQDPLSILLAQANAQGGAGAAAPPPT